MKTPGGNETGKRRAAEQAAATVSDGAVVGLGTGSTTAYAIRTLGEAVAAGRSIRGIPTSHQSRQLARSVGIELTTLAQATPDVAIDGADQVELRTGVLLKGGGGAHTREKIVDSAADSCCIVVDDSKLTETLDGPVAIELLETAWQPVERELEALGGTPTLRTADRKDGPVVSDNGHLIADCSFGPIDAPAKLAAAISTIPGVVDHGIFVDIADTVYVGSDTDVSVHTIDK